MLCLTVSRHLQGSHPFVAGHPQFYEQWCGWKIGKPEIRWKELELRWLYVVELKGYGFRERKEKRSVKEPLVRDGGAMPPPAGDRLPGAEALLLVLTPCKFPFGRHTRLRWSPSPTSPTSTLPTPILMKYHAQHHITAPRARGILHYHTSRWGHQDSSCRPTRRKLLPVRSDNNVSLIFIKSLTTLFLPEPFFLALCFSMSQLVTTA